MRFRFLFVILVSGLLLSGCTWLTKKEQAGLQIITGEEPSSVFIDGQYFEKSPLIQKDLKPGEYLIEIKPDDENLASYQTPVTLRAGLLTVLTWKPGETAEVSGGVLYEMEKINQRGKSEVIFATIPDGVIVTLDEGEKQIAPVTYNQIDPGQHVFEATLPSFETQKHTINVVEGYRMLITIKLAKNDVLPTPTTKPSPSVSPEISVAPNSEAAPATTSAQVKILPTNFFQDGKQVLRVRDESGASGQELGFAVAGQTYEYLNDKSNGWFKINFENQAGWVSGEFAQLL